MVSHFILILIVLIIACFNRVYPSLYWIQIIYYVLSMSLLLLGLEWTVSSVNVFVKDTAKFVSILVQFGFWVTPLFWSIEIVPAKYQFLIKMNPMFYIVSGYRDSILFGTGFWERPYLTLYFWGICLLLLASGAIFFKRLRPHFAQVI